MNVHCKEIDSPTVFIQMNRINSQFYVGCILCAVVIILPKTNDSVSTIQRSETNITYRCPSHKLPAPPNKDTEKNVA